MNYYAGFNFELNEGNPKWKEYYDSLGKKSFGVFSVTQYFTKKLKELAIASRFVRNFSEKSHSNQAAFCSFSKSIFCSRRVSALM